MLKAFPQPVMSSKCQKTSPLLVKKVDTGSVSEGSAKKKGRTVAVTTEDMQKMRNDTFGGNEATKKTKKNQLKQQYGNFKAERKETLEQTFNRLQAIIKYKDINQIDEDEIEEMDIKWNMALLRAILKTFGGNEATKKTTKNQLKQQYGNFKAEGSETLEQTFNRLQAIVSHLEFIDVEIEQDNLNQKFLTSLAPEWLMYTIVWRNRDDLDIMSLDDVYNHLKVYEPEVQKKSETNSQNMAFISSSNTSSGKASQSNGSQIKYEDITQIDEDDIKEMDIKCNMALLSMRADRFWKKNGNAEHLEVKAESYMANEEENHALVADDEAPTEFALMEKSSSSSKNKVEARLVEFKTQEIKFYEKIRGLERDVECCSPPPAQVYSPPKKDMSWTGLPEFVDDTVTDYSRPSPSIDSSKSNTSDLQNSNSSVSEYGESLDSIMSKPMIKFVKATDCPKVVKINKTESARKSPVKYAEMYRSTSKSPKVRDKEVARLLHKASCKTKLVNSMTKPLHTLHMDLFGPTSVSSVNHKWYCLVVTDDFSRFTWTFFLRTKDETSGILRNFITEIENLKDLKVKIMRCDNGGEFKNKEMNEFCTKKGIKREFSNAKTPQQNKAEAVNTACYVQNKVLVNKSQNKTPYKLFNSRTPALGFLRPFGCHVMILNTLDYLGKFEAKWNEGNFVGYFMSSKAFRVFNKRTKKVEENMHVDFLENKLIEKGAGPNWLFDIDTLTNSMNYVPVVVAGTSSTNISAHMESSNSDAQDACNDDVPESSGIFNPTATSKIPPADQMESLTVEFKFPTVSSPVPTACLDISPETSSDSRLISKEILSQEETPSLDNALTLSNRERKPRKGQNRIKTGQKREAWRSREKFKAVTVNKEGKTEQNTKRMARNANAVKSYSSFKRKKKRKGLEMKFLQSTTTGAKTAYCPKLYTQGTSYANGDITLGDYSC
nr:hypothetical protein [Tanacetum cinerariifolium]